ncbi:MAG TPA: gephyrin-like molybdotransferase Glp [Methylomirabilota bacterium]|nr:gephyrin-like molybdotransferase Glp [Methylomirabilota bacterium]
MISLEDAVARILDAIRPLPAEAVPLAEAEHRFVAAPVVAPLDLPPFDNSAMDGYAVRTADVAPASAASPVELELAGQLPAGGGAQVRVTSGRCVRVFTGSPLPEGADAVVMQEDTRTTDAQPDRLLVLDPVKPWENVRFRGEDIKRGVLVVRPGDRLGCARLGLLAALGISELQVHRRPSVGLLATGSELVEPGRPLVAGQVYESNRMMLAPLLRAAGAMPRAYPIVPDTRSATRTALERAFEQADVVVTTGGASVGDLDWVKQALADLGGETGFWRVAIKPGKPFLFGRWRDRWLFGLPGNPVSAFVTAFLLLRPAILRLQGAAETRPMTTPGRLAEVLINRGDRRHFVRVKVDSTGQVFAAGGQASHHLHSLAEAQGLVDVPPGVTLPVGAGVAVLRWE